MTLEMVVHGLQSFLGAILPPGTIDLINQAFRPYDELTYFVSAIVAVFLLFALGKAMRRRHFRTAILFATLAALAWTWLLLFVGASIETVTAPEEWTFRYNASWSALAFVALLGFSFGLFNPSKSKTRKV